MHREKWGQANYHPPSRPAHTSVAGIRLHGIRVPGNLRRLVATNPPHRHTGVCRSDLPARMVSDSKDTIVAISKMAPPVVPPWHRRHLAGDSLSSRRVRRCTAQRAHGGTPAVDVVCSAFASHRLARRSNASRSATRIHQIYRRTAHSPQKAAATGPLARQAARGLARYESYFPGLAHTGSLRLRPGTRTLA